MEPQNIVLEKSEETEVKKPVASFFLPSAGNVITGRDVANGQLKITHNFKAHFPTENSQITIFYKNKNKKIDFILRENKSSVLEVGKDFMTTLKMKEGNTLIIKVIKPNLFYMIEKN